MKQQSQSKNTPWYGWMLLIVLSPALIALGLIFIPARLAVRCSLYCLVWIFWCPRGRHVLYVYSDSPVWKAHIEAEVIPRLSDRAVILNWSRRKEWRVSLATMLFHHFAGSKEFNPLAIVFRPFRPRVEFRFRGPFQAWKKNKRDELEAMERSFLEVSGCLGQTKSGQGEP
ncbi:MAG: hypothetical protein V4675_17240 [Verrucomicrobiota bacterium]